MTPTIPANFTNLCVVTLVGNLVAKPEIRYSANPVLAIADFVLASNSRWFDKASNSMKEWTSYHPVKAVGSIVEKSILQANKGDIVLLNGRLSDDKKTDKNLITADFLQLFNKGFSQEINQVNLSGHIQSPVTLNTTEQGKKFAELLVVANYQFVSPINQQLQSVTIERPVHCWGKQAEYVAQHAEVGQAVIIAGKLQYLNNAHKSQYVEAQQVILLN